MDKENILIKQWNDKNNCLQLLIILNEDDYYDHDWVIIFGNNDYCLITGIYGCHPFVDTKSFRFGNSDGSTFLDINPNLLNFNQVKEILKSMTIEFIFDQCH